jgi:hypothetical protein
MRRISTISIPEPMIMLITKLQHLPFAVAGSQLPSTGFGFP